MKLIYDITTPGLPKYPHLGGPNEKMIRCVYDMTGVLSSLIGIHSHDCVHLKLSAKPGIEHETSTNPIHHHISILSSDPAKYAAVFNTKRFVIDMQRSFTPELLKKRFPQWTFVRLNDLGNPVMELTL